jgi:hypothetical protein
VHSVGVREFAERAKLLRVQSILKFKRHGHKSHGWIIASSARGLTT